MPIYVGGRKISGSASSDPSSGLSEGDVYYKTDTDKLRYYDGSAWKNLFPALGTDPDNPAANAGAVLASNSSAPSGYYYIQAGDMERPAQIWCDMTSGNNTTGVGGWNRFWWHGNFEQTGSDPTSFPDGDCFGNSLESLTHTATTGFGRIPTSISPTWLMVKTNNSQVSKNGSLLRYAIWKFDGSNTSNSVLASMRDEVARSSSAGDQSNWQPTMNASGNTSGWPGNVGNIDYWWYSDDHQSGRGKGFHLDDDSAYGNTSFAGGRDNGGNLGVDALTYGNPQNIVTNNLVLYWK
tara:strand:+ start:900 stop:1781 length:882 start_codon:yes stop_codon:yes gene_type:complete